MFRRNKKVKSQQVEANLNLISKADELVHYVVIDQPVVFEDANEYNIQTTRYQPIGINRKLVYPVTTLSGRQLYVHHVDDKDTNWREIKKNYKIRPWIFAKGYRGTYKGGMLVQQEIIKADVHYERAGKMNIANAKSKTFSSVSSAHTNILLAGAALIRNILSAELKNDGNNNQQKEKNIIDLFRKTRNKKEKE